MPISVDTADPGRRTRPAPACATDRLRRMARLFRIATVLQAGKAPGLEALAGVCGCATKTIQRDLSFLEELGVTLRYDGARKGYVLEGPLPFRILSMCQEVWPASRPRQATSDVALPCLSEKRRLLDTCLDLTLAEATCIALGAAAVDGPTSPLTPRALAGGLDKILAALPPEVAEQVVTARQYLTGHPGPGRDYSQAPFYPLLRACRERTSVEIDYESLSSGRRVRRVDPYAVAWVSGFWMLIARDPGRNAVLEFALDRVHECRPMAQRFALPRDWSLARYLAAGSVRVLRGEPVAIAVRFLPAVAPLARSYRWPFAYTVEEAPEGCVVLRGTVAGLEEITKELLRWGRHVEALEPPELRRRVAEEAQAILSLYGESPR